MFTPVTTANRRTDFSTTVKCVNGNTRTSPGSTAVSRGTGTGRSSGSYPSTAAMPLAKHKTLTDSGDE